MTLRNNRVASWIVKTLLVLLSTTLLITCDQLIPTPSTSDAPAPTYTVTYNANNADSGSVHGGILKMILWSRKILPG